MGRNAIIKTDGSLDYDKIGGFSDQIGILLKNVFYVEQYEQKKVAAAQGWDYSPCFNAAINDATVSGGKVNYSKNYTLFSTLWLKSNIALCALNSSVLQGNNVTELLKTDSAFTYSNIILANVSIDAGKVSGDDKVLVCSQFYNVTNLKILSSVFSHGSAAIGLDNCSGVDITLNTIKGMYQQTNAAGTAPGSYGYGVTVNQCNEVEVHHNFLGVGYEASGQIDRHAVYVSTHQTGTIKNSERVHVKNNMVYMKQYNVDVDMLTGFEYAFKSYSGDNIEFDNNIVVGGVGGVLLSTRDINGGKVKVTRNTFVECLKIGVSMFMDTPFTFTFDRVEIADNYFRIKGSFAIGVQIANTYQVEIKNNSFYSTWSDLTQKDRCYYVRTAAQNNKVVASYIKAEGNRICGFGGVGYINNTQSFTCDDYVEDFLMAAGVTVWNPFDYAESVSKKDVRIRFLENIYKFKKDNSAGLVGLEYYDYDVGMVIKCLAVNHWVDASGNKVAGLSTARPDIASIKAGYKYWEIDNSRWVYWTGFTWSTSNTIVPAYGTKAEILAINAGTSWSNTTIRNTDDGKNYVWNPVTAKWQDAAGSQSYTGNRIFNASYYNNDLAETFSAMGSEGGTILLPEGNYTLTQKITLNLTGRKFSLIALGNVEIASTIPEPATESAAITITGNATNKVKIMDVRMTHNGTTLGLLDGIQVNNVKKVEMYNNEIEGFTYWGVRLQQVLGGIVQNNYCDKNFYAGLGFDACENINMIGGSCSENGTTAPTNGYGVSCTTSLIGINKNITIRGVKANKNKRKGIDVHNGHDIKIIDNFITGFGYSGIYAVNESTTKDVSNVTIRGNTIEATTDLLTALTAIEVGIYSSTSLYSGTFIIEENIIRNTDVLTNAVHTIFVRSGSAGCIPIDQVVISKNTIERGTKTGGYLIQSDNAGLPIKSIVVSENKLHSVNASCGIGLRMVDSSKIIHNEVNIESGSLSIGIFSDMNGTTVIEGNEIKGSATYTDRPIFLYDRDYQTASNNIVFKNKIPDVIKNGISIDFGTQPPTTGYYYIGSIRYASAPVVGQPKGWQCTAAGTPGTWVSLGNL